MKFMRVTRLVLGTFDPIFLQPSQKIDFWQCWEACVVKTNVVTIFFITIEETKSKCHILLMLDICPFVLRAVEESSKRQRIRILKWSVNNHAERSQTKNIFEVGSSHC